MKIMYVCRIFSGLESSLNDGEWKPTGVPTITKMIEKLDASEHSLKFVMTGLGIGYDLKLGWKEKKICNKFLKGLKTEIIILPGEKKLLKILGRLRSKLNFIIHFITLIKIFFSFKPDLLYIDKSNYLFAAIIARYSNTPVLIRIMGIYPSMWDIFNRSHASSVMQRWSYKSPFKMVLCTQDGTDSIPWLKKALKPDVPRTVMLNGFVDKHKTIIDKRNTCFFPKDKILILFVGRMENIKGCHLFVDIIDSLNVNCKKKVHSIMIGKGSEAVNIKKKVENSSMKSNFTFIEKIPHDEIQVMHAMCDIYISLNKLGQLSNANIEALCFGGCVMLPDEGMENIYDDRLKEMFNDNSILKMDSENIVLSAKTNIEYLVNNVGEIKSRKKIVAEKAKKIFKTWDERVQNELEIIESLIT